MTAPSLFGTSEMERYGLNIAEQAGLEVAIVELRQGENLDELYYWGRINGEENDYLVIAATIFDGKNSFPEKKFYYTKSTKPEKLSQMPELTEEYSKKAASFVCKPFSGDASLPCSAQEEEEEEENVFREEHRLAYNVLCIDSYASIVPCGAYLVNATRSIVKNENFKGLQYDAAHSLSSFFHLRPPTCEYAQKALEKPTGLIRPADFLDKLSDDTPTGTWALHIDASHQIVSIRSLYFIGATFYHAIATPHYRNIYIGDGTPNLDLPFML